MAEKVKASRVIEELKKGCKAKVADPGDGAPYLKRVTISIEDDHTCKLNGWCGFAEDSARCGIDQGYCTVEVLGVVFRRTFIDGEGEMPTIVSGEIEYDGGLDEADVIAAAIENIDFPDYDPDDFSFDEKSVTADDIADVIENDDGHEFVEDPQRGFLVFENYDEMSDFYDNLETTEGHEVEYRQLDEREAFKRIAAQGLSSWDYEY